MKKLRPKGSNLLGNQQLRDQGAEPVANAPDQFAQEIKTDVEKWRKVANATGVKLE